MKYTPEELKGKFVVGFDTICEGNQCAKDENDNPDPNLYDSEAEARKELFGDAICGLEGTDDDYFKENEMDKETVLSEMRDILKDGDADKMRDYLSENSACNYYDEFIQEAEEFIVGRKAILTDNGVRIEGTKLEDL